ncbi:hypothetical protein BKA70DRAFT_1295835 [Coprinopsis sp. MPI-PUGE-AT-0042]|nr:hypothetical protein BKA70DRAFT_1295835 [Coprinopsis sp. MPI-PUGE-AT-0042]
MSLGRHHDFSSSIYGQANSERRSLADVQTLNADGTPKRPMNAFMIFARRRRPQVSAENQSLRTGEVSKLLSKEWSSMPAVTSKTSQGLFQLKYPDYSPEGDEHFDVGSDYSYSRPSQEGSLLRDSNAMKYGQRTTLPPVPQPDAIPSGQRVMNLGCLWVRLKNAYHRTWVPCLPPRMTPSSQTATGLYGQCHPQQGPISTPMGIGTGDRNRAAAPMWLDLKPVSIGASENWSNSPTSSNDSSIAHTTSSRLWQLPTTATRNQNGMQGYKTSNSSTAQYPQQNSTNLTSNRGYDPRGTSVLGMNEPLGYPARTWPANYPPCTRSLATLVSRHRVVGQLGSQQVYPWPRDFYNGRNEFDIMGISGLKDQ